MFTDEEREHLVHSVLALTNLQIRELMKSANIRPIGSTKADFRTNLDRVLASGELSYDSLIDWLDTYDPWRKQHVFVLDGPPSGVGQWTDRQHLDSRLAGNEDADCATRGRPLVLPEELTISRIKHSALGMSITAFVKREHREREPSLDYVTTTNDGYRVRFVAHREYLVRTAVIFEWDFATNTGVLRVTQLPSRESYDDMQDAFRTKVQPWFPEINQFPGIDLANVISSLHAAETTLTAQPETRSFGMAYDTPGGRTIDARAGSLQQGVLGETVSDNALASIRNAGFGRNGNFHWLSSVSGLPTDVRTIINAATGRVQFTANLDQASITHVVSRIRTYA
ncbi:MAG: hypothetical protein JXX28_06240 [Deltaproteobacteria bacterium]|nr:hypothetical protein [Deltaproteobacteria bacterium]